MIYVSERPNRIKTKNKDEQYHVDYARWVLSCVSMSNQSQFVYKSLINWAFYKGNQWMFHEDLDAFLMDESGDSRNRIKFIQNIIRPFVEFYRGSAIRMDISARAFSISSQSVDRREMARAKLDTIYELYKRSPHEFKGFFREKYLVGETPQENEDIFNNTYKDQFEEEVNDIINYLAEKNDIEDKKVQLIKHVVLDGIGILKEYERFGTQVVDVVDPRRFIFDSSAKSDDLKDSEYMGEWTLASVSDIAEECNDLSITDLKRLEKASAVNAMFTGLHNISSFEYNHSNGKIPVYTIEWRDIEADEFGAIINDNGVPELVLINNSKVTNYTDKDLIKKSELKKYSKDNFWIDSVLKGNNKAIVRYDAIRYIKFVPSEYIGDKNDFVLKFGLKEYEYKYSFNYKYPDWSYKVKCWGYDNGEILSPIDDLISPQRFLNRMLSMGESHINNTRGSNIIYDKSTIDSQNGEQELLRNINLGKPVGIDGAVNNSIGTYNNQIGAGTIQLFDIARGMEAAAKNIIGGGESLMGQGGAYRASATVNNQNLNQGTTMQEPVFYCLHKIILDIYESFSNRGRRILSANQNLLTVVAGEHGMKNIVLTRDYDLDEFRMRIERANNPAQERQSANEQLMMLLQGGLISQEIFSKYYNKSTLSSIGKAIREHTMIVIEQQRQQQKLQEAQQEKEANAARAAMQMEDLDRRTEMAMEEQQKARELSVGQANLMEGLLKNSKTEKSLS